MGAFLLLLALSSFTKNLGSAFWLSSASYWVYPLQVLVCGAVLAWFWKEYEFGPWRRPIFTLAIGVAVLVIWISPQAFFGFTPRRVGFDPNVFAGQPLPYWGTVMMRFLRLVIIVPLIEEIFWRGFLLRYLIDERFERAPFGTFSWLSFLVVSAAFALEHSMADWAAAFITGMLYNAVAYRTRSLTACVIVHAVTNLLLGLWIMRTGQWGFW